MACLSKDVNNARCEATVLWLLVSMEGKNDSLVVLGIFLSHIIH